MSNGLAKLKKLKGRSAAELRVRGRQFFCAWADARGLGVQAWPMSEERLGRLLVAPATARALLPQFSARQSPAFFAAFADLTTTCAELSRRFGGAAISALIERAERIKRGRFDLLGVRDLDFGVLVDWHLDPTSGVRAPRAHWSLIDFLDPHVVGDKKFIWELNRHQHFITLGRAYSHTGDEAYAETFAAHAGDWMDANPPEHGINWASSLEVGLRSIAWVWALYFFKDARALTPELFVRMLTFLYAHARHIETYLSTYFSPNTHLTGEALALYYLGTQLPEFKAAGRWRAKGERIMLAELDRHVLRDGVYFEHSTYYHRYTADFYTHYLLLARANGGSIEAEKVEQKLAALFDHLMYVTRPDGTTPLIGDDDGGQLAPLDDHAPDDFRSTLAAAATLFGRGDYKYVAGAAPESVLWLFGPRDLNAYDALVASTPVAESREFSTAGLYVLRDSWASDGNYMLIDGGPHGAREINHGHAHADALAFDLAAGGRTLLVDPGTYTYTGSSTLRDHFRISQAHNTLTIDGESSSQPAGPFRWRHVAEASTSMWLSRSRFDYFIGAHDGYRRLPSPAFHERAVLFLKRDYWIVRDRVTTSGAHQYELAFHFAANAAPRLVGPVSANFVRDARAGAPGLELYTFAKGGAWQLKEDWVSSAYGSRARAPVYTFVLEGNGDQEFISILAPLPLGERSIQSARELDAVGGRALTLASDSIGCHDVVILKAAGAVASAQVQGTALRSDFAWTWARFNAEDTSPQELLLLDGQHLWSHGQELHAPHRVGFVWARRAGEEWLVETDAGVELDLSPVRSTTYVRN